MQEEYTINVTPGYRQSRFSKRELGDIAIAVIVLSLALTILYNGDLSSTTWLTNSAQRRNG